MALPADPGPTGQPLRPAPGITVHRVLVMKSSRVEAASVVEVWGYEDVTAEQAFAYANGTEDWRTATAGSWFSRFWRRLRPADA